MVIASSKRIDRIVDACDRAIDTLDPVDQHNAEALALLKQLREDALAWSRDLSAEWTNAHPPMERLT